MLRRSLPWLIVAAVMPATVAAGPFADALIAYDQGDFASALKLWKSLAEKGDPDAQRNLGAMYAKGQGVPQDKAMAAKWYRRAAEQNDDSAQLSLGTMYASGDGLPKNLVLAHMWFKLAATQGNELASDARAAVASLLTPAQLAEAELLAHEWKPTSGR